VTLPETIPLLGFGWDDLLFMILAGMMVGSALLVVTMKDIIRCGLAMIICFAALAGLYVLAGAPVVAAAQVLVYIGAISVLVLFAIMLTQDKAGPRALVFQTQAFPAAIAAAVLALLIAVTVAATDWPGAGARIWTDTTALATKLFQDYTLPFEVVSVLLLAAVIGAVFLAKREPGGTD
jgi:NADH:ubiquinone oxidoreductase subunit 6 (subunit J)